MRDIAIIQSFVPHYRLEFFSILKKCVDSCIVYTYAPYDKSSKNFKVCTDDFIRPIKSFFFKGFYFFFPWKALSGKHNIVVAALNFSHLATWFLLLTKFFHRKKIILWGHGISVKRYLKEEIKPDWKLKLMIYLADGVWLYMNKEAQQWKNIFPNKPIVSLNNTLSGTEEMISYTPNTSKAQLKSKYQIKEEIILIFCARFETGIRRVDLLLEAIQKIDNKKFGFIIIGEGPDKPDFSNCSNVYDYGAMYDTNIKRELFYIADIYFQPGWVGLSIVEAMAYGKPIFTFIRTEKTKQCVEYSYIEDEINGKIFNNIKECIEYIEGTDKEKFIFMGNNARELVRKKMLPTMMVDNALSII